MASKVLKFPKRKTKMSLGLLELYMTIQLRLRTENLRDVAETANCCESTLQNWRDEKTKAPRISTLAKVADALGYSIYWIIESNS